MPVPMYMLAKQTVYQWPLYDYLNVPFSRTLTSILRNFNLEFQKYIRNIESLEASNGDEIWAISHRRLDAFQMLLLASMQLTFFLSKNLSEKKRTPFLSFDQFFFLSLCASMQQIIFSQETVCN